MNVQKIIMDPDEARAQLNEYRASLQKAADAEYEAVAAGLEALVEGTPIINVSEAIRAGGFHEEMRPRLAIARADRRQVRFRWESDSTNGEFITANSLAHATPSLWLTVDFERRHGLVNERGGWKRVEGYALVPMIPARVRRESGVRPSADRRHFILFEVEGWADHPFRTRPDRDPFLLRHLGGEAYAVLAEWDLTPLEQMVMAGRREAS